MKSILAALCFALALTGVAQAADIDWSKVDAAMARKATLSGAVHRYGVPRSDLHVSVDGVAIKTNLALGGWVAFEDMGGGAMMMGDLVLTETEVNPVVSRLLANGIEVTALHNHLLRTQPAIYYLHVGGQGDAVKLAEGVRDALSASGAPPATAAAQAPALDLPTADIDAIIGAHGVNNGGVYQFSVPRSDEIKAGGMAIPPAMGCAIAIGFQPTGKGSAAVTGDFVARADEVNPLLKALRSGGVEVTAVHSHMLDEEPRVFFVHFWANSDALKLARVLRAGLDAVHAGRKS